MLVLSEATNFQRLHWRTHSKLTPTCVGRILKNKIGVRQRPAALPGIDASLYQVEDICNAIVV